MTSEVMTQIAFFVMALMTLGGAVGVVVARTVFVSALWLILSFVGVAGMYVLLGAGFLAAIQILIYVGAISVLILFAVMLTHDGMTAGERPNSQWALGLILALCFFGFLGVIGYSADWPLAAGEVPPNSGVAITAEQATGLTAAVKTTASGVPVYTLPDQVTMIGRAFMTEQLLAFEVISMILLIALVGAIVVARE